MDNQRIAEPGSAGASRGQKILWIVGIGAAFLLCMLAIVALAFVQSTGMLRRHLEISAADIPLYPNTRDISQQGSATGGFPQVTTWTFTSGDAPEVVWQFYEEQMRRRWGFREVSPSDSGVRGLIVDSCPFYHLAMSSAAIDATTYRYTIRFGEEPCR